MSQCSKLFYRGAFGLYCRYWFFLPVLFRFGVVDVVVAEHMARNRALASQVDPDRLGLGDQVADGQNQTAVVDHGAAAVRHLSGEVGRGCSPGRNLAEGRAKGIETVGEGTQDRERGRREPLANGLPHVWNR